MSIEITIATATERIGIREALDIIPDGAAASIRSVFTQAQFVAALAEPGDLTIRLCANIILPSGTTTIAVGKAIEFNGFRLTKAGVSLLVFLGECLATRREIFTGFTAGNIVGTFGGVDVFPEWWGLVEGRHDIAINCAIQAAPRDGRGGLAYPNWFGLTISLAPRIYSVARPIDCSGGYINLKGSGSAQTTLHATSAWTTDTWEQAEIWDDPVLNVPNHAAVLWIGGPTGGATYRNQVTGIYLNLGDATFAHRATNKRISGISSKGGVEECSIIDEVVITYATGFGIGFCRHKASDGSYPPATVNGLRISNFWIYGATYRNYYGMYFSQWTNNCHVDTGTIAGGLAKSISAQWNTNTSTTPPGVGFDTSSFGPLTYPDPIWIRTYPLAAIHLSGGYVTLNNIHIEGSMIGVLFADADGPNNCTINSVKVYGLMDRSRSPVYMLDGTSGAAPPANTSDLDYYGYGCAVLFAGRSETLANPKNNAVGCCTITALTSSATTYLIRDAVYGIHLAAFGMGQFALSPTGEGMGGRVAFYSRGNIYRIIPGITPTLGQYDYTSPPTDRTYFLGPIY
jgi:hypothetical protein